MRRGKHEKKQKEKKKAQGLSSNFHYAFRPRLEQLCGLRLDDPYRGLDHSPGKDEDGGNIAVHHGTEHDDEQGNLCSRKVSKG